MNVLIYTPRAFAISETFIFQQATELPGINPVILTHHRQNIEHFNLHIPFFEIAQFPSTLIDRVLSFFLRVIRKSGKHTLPYSSERKVRQIIKDHKIEAVHCHYGMSAVVMFPIIKRLTLKLVVSFHGYDASIMLKEDRLYTELIKKVFSYQKTYVILVSPNMADRLLPLGLKKENSHLIPYGVDTNLFKPPANKRTQHDVIILHSGRLTAKKGIPDLIYIFKELKENYPVKLWIIGDGPLMTDVKKLVDDYNLSDSVEFFGAIPNKKIVSFMQKTDIFVLNSRESDSGDREGSPVSIMEAMSAGLPVVSTDHEGIPLSVDHNQNGFIVQERDNNSFKNAIECLLNEPGLRLAFGKNARDKAVKQFDKTIVLQNISFLLQQ